MAGMSGSPSRWVQAAPREARAPQAVTASPCAFQNQLLTKGMVILRDKIRFYEGEWRPA